MKFACDEYLRLAAQIESAQTSAIRQADHTEGLLQPADSEGRRAASLERLRAKVAWLKKRTGN